MPPKARLHKSTGKVVLSKQTQVQNGSEAGPSSVVLSPEAEQQFELELCWCIQQLQTGLKSGKLNNKQVQDHTNALNTLMGNSPIIKKRQVMRLSFGDYREKMKAEGKKASRSSLANIKVTTGTPSKNSVFVKKSNFVSTGNSFRFNFEVPKEEDISNDLSNVKLEPTKKDALTKSVSYVPSSNTFKFNFNIENTDS